MPTSITTIIALPMPIPGKSGYVAGINNEGQVIGTVDTDSGGSITISSVLWQNGSVTTFGDLPGYNLAIVTALNDKGQVVGSAGGGFHSDQPVLWQNGIPSYLPSLSNNGNTDALAINENGLVVGDSTTAAGYDDACVWQNGIITSLGALPGGNSVANGGVISAARAVNSAGAIAGYSQIGGGVIFHAVLWQNGTMTDLGLLPTSSQSLAFDINNNGKVIGYCSYSNYTDHAFQWQNGVMADLGTLTAGETSTADSINNAGIIVGDAQTSNFDYHAVMWENGAIIDLNNLLPANSGWVLTRAVGINDNGQITGDGTFNGTDTEFVLTLGSAAVQFSAQSAAQALLNGVLSGTLAVSDSVANVTANLSSLQTMAAQGRLSSISLSDSGIPTLSITSAQAISDAAAIAEISGNFSLTQSASGSNQTIAGLTAALGNTVVFGGDASHYTIRPAGDGVNFSVASGGVSDSLNNVQALQFSDTTEIVAATPSGSGVVTGGNITELYGAVFGRVPDVPGLDYYEKALASNPGLSLTTLAEDFLSSPEYTGNAAHAYAQTSAGDAQFITDSYNNLLHRAPESGAIPYYQNLIGKFTQGLTAGTTAYTTAELQAHATMLVDFSASAEFLGDVQVTAANPASSGFAGHWLVLI